MWSTLVRVSAIGHTPLSNQEKCPECVSLLTCVWSLSGPVYRFWDDAMQVLEMKQGLKLPLDDYQATKEMLSSESPQPHSKPPVLLLLLQHYYH